MANIIMETARGYQPIAIEDELLKSREIFMCDQVDGASCNELAKQLMYLERQDPNAEITIYINSPGGSVQDGLAIYDLIMLMKSPVRTVCMGTCASMGAILFLAGKKREMMSHGKIMIHDPAFGGHREISGKKPHEIQTELDDLNRCREALAKIIAERMGHTVEEIEKVTVNDAYYDPDEAVEFGLATAVLTKKGDI